MRFGCGTGESPRLPKDGRHGAPAVRMERQALAEEVDAEAAGGDGGGGIYGGGGGVGVAGGKALGGEFAV